MLKGVLSLQCMLPQRIRSSVCCRVLKSLNMAGVACRGLWCVCGWKDVGMVI